jgi:hypothetical protein
MKKLENKYHNLPQVETQKKLGKQNAEKWETKHVFKDSAHIQKIAT